MTEIKDHNLLFQRLAWLNAVAAVMLVSAFVLLGLDQTGPGGCNETIIDFRVFWVAGRFGIEGTPLLAFDPERLQAALNGCETKNMLWLHPAGVMMLLTPFGAIPFLHAWGLFTALSMAALALSLRAFTSNKNGLLVATLFAPAVVPAILAGQFTTVWIAGLLAAIAALRTDRPILAGILIGLLTIKPTLGVLLPAALLAIWALRTIIAASITTIVFHGIPTMVYGLEYWSVWRKALSDQGEGIIALLGDRDNFASIAALLVELGIVPESAVMINFGLAGVLALIVFLVWRRYSVKSDISVAVLFAAIPIATPYLWQYDAAFLGIAALFILKSTTSKIGPLFGLALFFIWMGPGLPIWYGIAIGVGAIPYAFTLPLTLLLALALSLAPIFYNSSSRHT